MTDETPDPGDKGRATERKAVALKYEQEKDPAPRLTAKGEGHIAEQLIAIAREHDIEVRENADLVEVLSAMEVEEVIPVEAYAAVAEILSYVYQANASHNQREERQE